LSQLLKKEWEGGKEYKKMLCRRNKEKKRGEKQQYRSLETYDLYLD